jgi:hypothetical protein
MPGAGGKIVAVLRGIVLGLVVAWVWAGGFGGRWFPFVAVAVATYMTAMQLLYWKHPETPCGPECPMLDL